MKQIKAQKIVIIGCGNLSWHLALKLSSIKKFELHVFNHRSSPALKEFKKLKCKTHESLNGLIEDASYYLLCIPDRFISETSSKIKSSGIVIHCSGSKNIVDINAENKGVIYPVQTFSKKDTIDWKNLPLLIEANSKTSESEIRKLALNLSKKIIHSTSEDRLRLHLSAVLVNNFTNALYTAADEFLSSPESNSKFSLLLPLINQTVKKLDAMSPRDAQTGPAKRNDEEVMNAHLSLLKENKRLKKTYKQISKLIQQQHGTHA